MSRGNMRGQVPGGEGELVDATALLTGEYDGEWIALNPGGGEYAAKLMSARDQGRPSGWVRIQHQREGFARPTTNVVPPSTQVRVLD